jgi:hypothetical protein
MTTGNRPFEGNRIVAYQRAWPLDPAKPLAPHGVPEIPRTKFRHIPGQLAMDFDSDEWDALTELAS